MAKDVIRVSEAEAVSDFASLMARVRSGTEVVIEDNSRPVAVVRPLQNLTLVCSRNPFVSRARIAQP